MIALIVLTIFSATCKKGSIYIVPESEWGHIEYFGQIIDGQITEALAAKIQGKTVAAISLAALEDYLLLKKYANKHNLNYK